MSLQYHIVKLIFHLATFWKFDRFEANAELLNIFNFASYEVFDLLLHCLLLLLILLGLEII